MSWRYFEKQKTTRDSWYEDHICHKHKLTAWLVLVRMLSKKTSFDWAFTSSLGTLSTQQRCDWRESVEAVSASASVGFSTYLSLRFATSKGTKHRWTLEVKVMVVYNTWNYRYSYHCHAWHLICDYFSRIKELCTIQSLERSKILILSNDHKIDFGYPWRVSTVDGDEN